MDWQEQFLRLYTSKSLEDFSKALELKREHIPPKLYRYRAITDGNMKHRVNEIVHGELFLSHPKDFNDPFEVCSMLHNTSPGSYFHTKDLFKELFKDKMPPEVFESIFAKDDFFEALAEYVAEKSGPSEKVKETKDVLLQVSLDGIKAVKFGADNMFRSMIRFACFSTTPDNLPMWHHYTNGHTGICLEFDTSQITNPYQINKLFPVNYVDKLPDIIHIIAEDTHSKFSIPTFQAIHKLKDWRYENEWRLIYEAGSFYYSIDDVPKDFWNNGKTIEFIRPSRIILGMNISAEHEEIIHKTAKQCGIPVTKAEFTAFGIKTDTNI